MPDPPVFSEFEKAVLNELGAIRRLLEQQASDAEPVVDLDKVASLPLAERRKFWKARRDKQKRVLSGK